MKGQHLGRSPCGVHLGGMGLIWMWIYPGVSCHDGVDNGYAHSYIDEDGSVTTSTIPFWSCALILIESYLVRSLGFCLSTSLQRRLVNCLVQRV